MKKKGTEVKENEVRGESNQENEEQIMVKNKELKDQEKEKGGIMCNLIKA